jgi:ABC-type transport system involved in Fe-S cluster assembly fused permease/ATPase subunit
MMIIYVVVVVVDILLYTLYISNVLRWKEEERREMMKL